MTNEAKIETCALNRRKWLPDGSQDPLSQRPSPHLHHFWVPAVTAKIDHKSTLGRCLEPCPYLSVPGRVYPPLPPPAVHIPPGRRKIQVWRCRQRHPKLFFHFFCPSKLRSKTWTAQKLLLCVLFLIFGCAGVDFRRFGVPKQVPGAYFFGVFSKTAILLKSCSCCGGSTIFKV